MTWAPLHRFPLGFPGNLFCETQTNVCIYLVSNAAPQHQALEIGELSSHLYSAVFLEGQKLHESALILCQPYSETLAWGLKHRHNGDS